MKKVFVSVVKNVTKVVKPKFGDVEIMKFGDVKTEEDLLNFLKEQKKKGVDIKFINADELEKDVMS